MAITLKDIKSKGRYIARSKMSMEQLDYFNKLVAKHRKETERLELSLINKNRIAPDYMIVSPIYLPMRRKEVPDRKYALNLNQYRNWDHITSNNLKIRYKELMQQYIKGRKYSDKIHVEYKIFWAIQPDGMNICSIVSKFILDALQDELCIKDDKISMVTESYTDGGKDRDHPRCEIIITNV